MRNYPLGTSVIRIDINTWDPDNKSAPITLAGTPTAAVFKDGGTTPITTGVGSITVDSGSTGAHILIIDASDTATYSAGSEFTVRMTAGTVGGISVAGRTIAKFAIDKEVCKVSDKTGFSLSSAGITAIWAALTSGLTTVGSIGKYLVDQLATAFTATQVTQLSDINTNAARLTATRAAFIDNLNPVVGVTLNATQGLYAPAKVNDNMNLANGAITSAKFATDAISSASVSTAAADKIAARVDAAVVNSADGIDLLQAVADKIAADWVAGDASPLAIVSALTSNATFIQLVADAQAAKNASQAVNTTVGTAGAGLTNIPYNTAWNTSLETRVTNSLNAYDPPTKAEMDARTLLSAEYATATELTATKNLIDPEIAQMKAIIDQLATMLVANGPTYQFTADALALAPVGGGGGGGTDWTANERTAIKTVLGIATNNATPVTPTAGILASLNTLCKLAASGAVGSVQVSGTVPNLTLTFKDVDGTTTLATVSWNTSTGSRTRLS